MCMVSGLLICVGRLLDRCTVHLLDLLTLELRSILEPQAGLAKASHRGEAATVSFRSLHVKVATTAEGLIGRQPGPMTAIYTSYETVDHTRIW